MPTVDLMFEERVGWEIDRGQQPSESSSAENYEFVSDLPCIYDDSESDDDARRDF